MAATDPFIAQTAIVNGFRALCCIKPLQVCRITICSLTDYLAC